MYKSRLRWFKIIIKKRIKTNYMQVSRFIDESWSNNSSDMSVEDQKPAYDSLI